jgi:hypothetical protein
MNAPIQFFRKNTNTEPGILFWPFRVIENVYFPAFDGDLLGKFGPYWSGDWQAPPPEICDILTASEWRIQFEFDGSGFAGSYELAPVSLDTTIKPGQVKRKTELDGEYEVGGDGYISVEEIITANFLESEDYEDTLTDRIFDLSYEWSSPVIEDGETLDGVFSVVNLFIRLYPPRVAKDENDEWAWIFESAEGAAQPLATYSAVIIDTNISGEPILTIGSGNVINFMDNEHDDPVDGFPVVSLSIESHFGEV